MTYLFPDTNIFLHYRWIGEIDWCAEIASDQVTLVVAHTVVRELDRHKTLHPKKHLRSRARTVVQRLRDLLDKSGGQIALRDRTSLVWSFRKPGIDFADHDLDRADPDDQLLAAVIDFRKSTPESSPLVVTADLGLELHARQQGVGVVRLDERYRLAEELDPLELENRELKRQLATFRDASPRLVLALHGQTPPFTVSMPAVERLTDEVRNKLLRSVKDRHPNMPLSSEQAGHMMSGAFGAFVSSQQRLGSAFGTYRYQPSDEQITRYNDELAKYLDRYANEYLPRFAKHRNVLASTLCVNLELQNEGSAPAEDVTIELVLPENTVALSELPAEPRPPDPPREPGVLPLGRGLDGFTIPPLRPPYTPEPEPNVSGPWIEEGADPRQATFHVHRLKHLSVERLDPVYVVFTAPEDIGNFKMEYRLVVGNMPKATVDSLNITVNRDKRP